MDHAILRRLSKKTDSKIVLLVFDGIGDLSMGKGTPLEVAATPNLDALAKDGCLGQAHPVGPGITPGSGPGHLALFGYDPLQFEIGRGILSALGVGFDIKPGDVAARANFATLDDGGNVTDRRAGRIPTETCVKLCEMLRTIDLGDVELYVEPEKEHRAGVVMRGKGLSGALSDSDPQETGVSPRKVTATNDDPAAVKTAKLAQTFLDQAFEIIKDEHPANGMLLRGFDSFEALPLMDEVYNLKAAAIATYPMYRGVSRLVGMDILDAGDVPETEFDCLEKNWADYDFFYLHIKKTDSYGEDGNFDQKVHVIEDVDKLIPRLRALNPDVICVTADHSTPCLMKAHSFHPVPVLFQGPLARVDDTTAFSELQTPHGGLGTFQAVELISLMLAHAGKLEKYGA